MKGAAIVIFCVALANAKPRDHVELNVAGCPTDDTEKFQPHEYCDQFYQCVSGTPYARTCPSNLFFNTEDEICDWPNNVNCDGRIIPENRPEPGGEEEERPGGHGHSDPSLAPEICAAEDSDGVLVAHEHCYQFYVCQTGYPVALRCPGFLLYNPENEQCDWPKNVQCAERVTESSAKIHPLSPPSDAKIACAQEDSNGALLPHENCNRFYKCDGGNPVALNCPAGLVYNIEAEYCDWTTNVTCGERTIAVIEDNQENNGSWIPAHGHSDPSKAPEICAAEGSDSVLVAHEDCKKFYKCYKGVPVTIDCPLFLLYNPAFEYCDWPQNVDCAGRNQ